VRLALPAEAMPINIDNTPVDVAPLNRFDGFAPSAPALVVMPNGISGVGLPPPEDPAKSLAADSPIVLWNMDTHARAPFFAEIDQNVTDPKQRALIIRPMVRLDPASHYAVFLRNTLKDVDGARWSRRRRSRRCATTPRTSTRGWAASATRRSSPRPPPPA
jgi:hypothetical protein